MNKSSYYERLRCQLETVCSENDHWLSILSNSSALLWMELEEINWVGFYLLSRDRLILGPFQGKPACTNIEIGRGVCGISFAENSIQRIANVHEFDGHIACDSNSQSEIVLPLYSRGHLIGVLDIDSPATNRFDSEDEAGLVILVKCLSNSLSDIDF
ncbi:MAG: Free methionine-R-sulfoxide reductase [Candidatus Celerinatantimonas neptuna]|nr:MAG: Free methionine-R-sulfoxide reductase [Candidatus Celerinatantimonas neptuna]